VRLPGGDLAGADEGTVSSLGLLYTVLASGEDEIMIPNSLVMNVAVVPLREPTAVDIRARLRAGVTPIEVERVLRERISTPIRGLAARHARGARCRRARRAHRGDAGAAQRRPQPRQRGARGDRPLYARQSQAAGARAHGDNGG
jgi:hypothetical protein